MPELELELGIVSTEAFFILLTLIDSRGKFLGDFASGLEETVFTILLS